jgi:hypothetical protein
MPRPSRSREGSRSHSSSAAPRPFIAAGALRLVRRCACSGYNLASPACKSGSVHGCGLLHIAPQRKPRFFLVLLCTGRAFLRHNRPSHGAAQQHFASRCCLRNSVISNSVPGLKRRFNSLSGFIALIVKPSTRWLDTGPAWLRMRRLTIRRFLDGHKFDPETIRLMGIAFEMARSAVTRRADFTDEIIARTIIELAKAGESNVDILCEAALKVPAWAVSAVNLPPPPSSPPRKRGSST